MVVLLLLSSCTSTTTTGAGATSTATSPVKSTAGSPVSPAPTSAVGPACRPLRPVVAAHPDAASAARAAATLTAFAAVGWNPAAPPARPSTLVGGMFINYRPGWNGSTDAATNTNITTAGDSDADSGSSPRHDPLTDLAILRNIDALESTGTTNAVLEEMRCRLQPVTEAEFATYGVPRAWIYGQLVDLSQLDADGPWATQAKTYATLLAKLFVNGIGPTAEFRPDWIAESAAALTDAGRRFAVPAWSGIGRQLALELVRTSADPTTGLFPGQARATAEGAATVVDPLVKTGSQAQLIDALLSVAVATKDETVLAAVRKSLAALQSPAIGLRDAVNGGWFYAVDVDGTGVRKAYKETRQGWLVALFTDAAAAGLMPAEQASQMRTVVREQLYQPDSRGYVYRVKPDFSPYVTKQNGQRLPENWVSTEATGIAVQALLGPLT